MFATILLPNFFLQAVLRHDQTAAETPIALIDDEAAKAVILQINQPAEKAGVTVGMTASQGLARCLELIVKTRQREQERIVGDLLVQFSHSLSPFVEATAPGICTVQFTDPRQACVRVEEMVDQLARNGLRAVAGLAHNPDTSLLAAHLARPVLQVGDTKTFLASLPIETLL